MSLLGGKTSTGIQRLRGDTAAPVELPSLNLFPDVGKRQEEVLQWFAQVQNIYRRRATWACAWELIQVRIGYPTQPRHMQQVW